MIWYLVELFSLSIIVASIFGALALVVNFIHRCEKADKERKLQEREQKQKQEQTEEEATEEVQEQIEEG